MPLLTSWGHLSDSPLIHLPHTTRSSIQLIGSCALCFEVAPCIFLQPCVIEPNVVVATIMRQFLLVLDSTLAQNRVFEGASCTMLLLEFSVRGIQVCRLGAWYTFEGKLMEFQYQERL